jgi:2-polyprenyl-3-methyl-5-hydroxy-6-metoxy-1,4-benzoquinol methylase
MNHVHENNKCLACGSNNIQTALDLGVQPLANAYKIAVDDAEDCYPLAVRLCYDCYHLQLSHTVDPEIIYKNYLYATGTNNTIQEYSRWFANFCLEYLPGANSVLDIGCNDGTQLDYFKELGFQTYGIDPAENLHDRSSANHSVVCDFFGPDAVSRLLAVDYNIITAQNVCAHNPDPLGFLQSCRNLMREDTLLFVQTSQADMVLHNEFDTIYHEHINFFNANSMFKLAQRAGLHLVDVVKTPIHGNSYIFVLSLSNSRQHHVQNIIAMEEPLLKTNTYQAWRDTVESNMAALKFHVDQYRKQGYRLVGYGAAAKGNTLLNYAELDLDFIVDDNPLKQGLYTPGRAIPIVGIEQVQALTQQDRVLFIPLAWNFFNEIRERILAVRKNEHDEFLRYFPTVELVK